MKNKAKIYRRRNTSLDFSVSNVFQVRVQEILSSPRHCRLLHEGYTHRFSYLPLVISKYQGNVAVEIGSLILVSMKMP